MFGYIKKYDNELKVKDLILYRNLYCSLCNDLGKKYGIVYRVLTSYDATFFLSIFDGVDINKATIRIKCPFNPFIKTDFQVSDNALNYVSIVSAYYAVQKLKDNIIDERKLKYRLLYNYLMKKKKIRNIFENNKILIDRLEVIINEYYQMEAKTEDYSFDKLTNKMGELFGVMFSEFAEQINNNEIKENLYSIGFEIGKWIYIVDAFDDLKEDIKRKKFNPILYMINYSTINDEILVDKIMFIHSILIDEIVKNLKNMKISNNLAVIENIVKFGMTDVICKIARKKYKFVPNGS